MGKRREDHALSSVQIRLLKEAYEFCIRGALTRKGIRELGSVGGYMVSLV